MDRASKWTPRESVRRECTRRGRRAVVDGCVDLLAGRGADPDLIVALGGPPARWAKTGEASGPEYWLKVWAARGLLWNWDEVAVPTVLSALDDEAWRVREMALRVVARHSIRDGAAAVARLENDPSARVRSAAARARARLSSDGAV
jgi:HEAT repeat protein